jgi:hypothetical protein
MVKFDAENKLICKITIEQDGVCKISVRKALNEFNPESVVGDAVLQADELRNIA